ncbi:hypothetical protein EC968_002954 [Mortierella alpina]|nr:hypothetical protein EC968_002954 [Mortierella alpina]
MSSQESSSPARHRIPPEIIAEIGQWLDGKTLLAALQVSKTWYRVHQPILWSSLTEAQWSHPQFPFYERMSTDDRFANIPKYQGFLPLVRHIAYQSLISRDDEYGRLFMLQAILQQTRNLRSLALKVVWRHEFVFSVASALKHCPQLKSLRISCPDFRYIKDKRNVISVVSQLEELYLPQISPYYFFKDCQESNLPPLAVWEMRKLRIAHGDMPMLEYCPKLRELEIRLDVSLSYLRPQAIMACPDLEVLKITIEGRYDEPFYCNLAETLRSLKRLKFLQLPIRNVDQIESLCLSEDSHDDASSLTDTQVLPMLEHLEMSDVQLKIRVAKSDELHKCLTNILRTRPLLKTFIFRGHEIKPWHLFAQPGLESRNEWRCMALETLDLHFTWRLYTRPLEERSAQWRSVFRQIGKLPKLKSLSIVCDGLEKSIDAGILELGGAKSLARLHLCDRQEPTWTKEEVMTLMQVTPSLVFLSLSPTSNYDQIVNWIKETGRDLLP